MTARSSSPRSPGTTTMTGLRQGDIADRLGLSRIKVSRLLDRGRQSGLIEVQINSRYEGGLRLQDELIKRFGLTEARVIPALDEAPADTRIGQAAAKFLARWLQPHDLLAIGWGRAVTAALRALSPTLIKREISLVSLTGGVSSYVAGVGMNGAHSDVHLIPTPLRVSTPEFAEMLGREPYVRNVLSMALTARVAIVGIGATSRNATLVRDGYCTMAEIDLFVRQGAVGDILGYFYDRDGNILSLDLHDHVVAVKLNELEAHSEHRRRCRRGGEGRTDPGRAARKADQHSGDRRNDGARHPGEGELSDYLLVIDAGTGSVRAVVFDARGQQLGVGQEEWTHIAEPGVPGSMSFDTSVNWQRVVRCIGKALGEAGISGDQIRAVSSTSMREAIVLYDAAGTRGLGLRQCRQPRRSGGARAEGAGRRA